MLVTHDLDESSQQLAFHRFVWRDGLTSSTSHDPPLAIFFTICRQSATNGDPSVVSSVKFVLPHLLTASLGMSIYGEGGGGGGGGGGSDV